MSSATETATFALNIDASQADAQLAKTRTAAIGLGGGFSGLTGNLEKLDRAEREASKALSGLGGAMGGMNAGVRNAVGGIGDLAGLLSGGGALGIGLAAAAAGVSYLTKKWEEEAQAAFDAIDKQYSTIDSLIGKMKEAEGVRLGIDKQLAGPESKKEVLNRMKVEQEQFRKTIAAAQSDVDAVNSRGADSLGGVAAGELRQRVVFLKRTADEYRDAALGQYELLVRAEEDAAKKGGARVVHAEQKGWLQAFGAAAKKMHAERVASYAELNDHTSMGLVGPGASNSEFARGSMVRGGQFGVERDPEYQAEQLKQEKLLAMREDYSFAARDVWKEEQSEFASLGMASTSLLIGSFQGYLDAKIAGSKYAEEMMAADVLKGVGQQLVGFGTMYGFKGLGYLIDSAGADPRGYALMALGVAATGAGIGMGAGGTAISVGVASKQAQDDQASQVRRDRQGERERGTGRQGRRGGGGSSRGGGGGGVTVNVNYGFGGPPSERDARVIGRVVDRVNRRGLGGGVNL